MIDQSSSSSFWNRIKSSVLLNLFFAAAACIFGYAFWNAWTRAAVLKGESEAVRRKNEMLEKEKREMETSIKELETAEVREREAKDKLNLKKPGEEVVVVVPEQAADTGGTATSSAGIWNKVKEFFGW